MSYFPKSSLNENDLAIIERGNTAAHSIEAGKYVSWHGRTGKAKAAILQGATLSESLFDYEEGGTLNEISSILRTGTVTITTSRGLGTMDIGIDIQDVAFVALRSISSAGGLRNGYIYDTSTGTTWNVWVGGQTGEAAEGAQTLQYLCVLNH